MKHPDFPPAGLTASEASPLSQLLARPASPASPHPSLGRLAALETDGAALVEIDAGAAHRVLAARSCVALSPAMVGQDVLVVFVDGNLELPVVVGVLQSAPAEANRHVESDGERVVISARSELVLRCGDASITLTKAGKVLLNGAYVSSRSTGVNRIRGGSVEIN